MKVKARPQKMKHRNDQRINQARSDIQAAYLTCTENLTEEKYNNLKEKKKVLEKVYNATFGKELNHEITQTDQANRTNKDQ